MKQLMVGFLACLTLGACGVGETAISAAAGGASEVQQAKEATKTEERVKQQLDEATKAEAQRRQAAEAASQ